MSVDADSERFLMLVSSRGTYVKSTWDTFAAYRTLIGTQGKQLAMRQHTFDQWEFATLSARKPES